MELKRGRLIDHVHLRARDLEASRRFYTAILGVLGVPVVSAQDHFFADDQAGLAAGGRDNGAPGERRYHPGYYAAFLLDPDGNNVEAVFHGPSTISTVP